MMNRTTHALAAGNGFNLAPEMTRWVDRALDLPSWSQGEVNETDESAIITLDVPGVRPEQVTVAAEDRVLQVKAERDGRSSTVRHYTVGSKYDLSRVEAHLSMGVLTLTLPKAEEAKARQIAVTAA